MTIVLTQTGKRAGALLSALVVSISLPLLIWVAVITALREIYVEWRAIRGGLLAGNLACSLDADCPPRLSVHGWEMRASN